ncbi:pyridoxal phosphate-dependent aminotransferase [Catellatospora chokoriensis]|uniref:Aminotransferase n=1 Tax=Catellatospora chokoriensis TaxID=310353 RepID=A0A8J3K7D0_9ACTN|nr:pyridoxal phosphate-dependent aminotransferase [Catellatospora chokoriensis]GIF94222.1 aminotransferase [Catellatospora chokoriensis]
MTVSPGPVSTRPARFPAASMSDLVDRPVRYDLAESTCPPLRLGELLDGDTAARLATLDIGYGTSQGDAELRALIASGAGVAPGEVLVTAGGSTGMFLLAFTLCRPEDHAVVVTPCFPPARAALDAIGCRVTPVALSFDAGYRLDVDAVAAALTPDTRLVSLASPQNPSGVRFTEPELRDLLDRMEALAPQAVLLVDETYRQAGYGAAAVPRSAARLAPRVVTCSSVSKAHGAPGIRVGWLTATDPALYESLRSAKFHTLITGSGVDELLAVEVLRREEQILGDRRQALAAALDTLDRWATGHADAVEFVRPDGGALCCLRLRPDRFDDHAVRRFYDALAERETRVGLGGWFGEPDRVFRLGFGHLPAADFRTALDRVAEALSAA